jgi:hypothetical protein
MRRRLVCISAWAIRRSGAGVRLPGRGVVLADPGFGEAELVEPAQGLQVDIRDTNRTYLLVVTLDTLSVLVLSLFLVLDVISLFYCRACLFLILPFSNI